MNFPKLNELSWGDVISVTAWIAVAIYAGAVLRADINALKIVKDDHEIRIRLVETGGSNGLSKHVAVDDLRQANTDAEIMEMKKQIAEMHDAVLRTDMNVKRLLRESQP
jgi:hypothetical protein